MLKLRIHRTFTWELAERDPMHTPLGGKPHLKLVAHDELQYCDTDSAHFHWNSQNPWLPVPVVEEPKPVHPEEERREREREAAAARIRINMADILNRALATGKSEVLTTRSDDEKPT